MNGSFLKEDYNLAIVSPEAVVQSWALRYYPYIYDDLHQSTKPGICVLTNTSYDIVETKFSTECKLQKIFWDISWWCWWVWKAVCEKAIHFSTFSASRHPAIGWICSLRRSKALTLHLSSSSHPPWLMTCFCSSHPQGTLYISFVLWSCSSTGVVWRLKPPGDVSSMENAEKYLRALSFLGLLYRTGQTRYIWKDNTLAIPLLHTGLLIFLSLSHDLHHFCWNSHFLFVNPPPQTTCLVVGLYI